MRRLNNFFWSNYRFCMKPQIHKIQMPARQLCSTETHWFSLSLLNPALSTFHPNFHRLLGKSALYHSTSLLVEMRCSTTALYFDHKPQHYPFSSRSGRYFDYIVHSVSCHVLHLLTPSSSNCF